MAYMAANQKPPADMAALAVSILKSSDASPEMREWAADAVGIQNDIGMPAKAVQQWRRLPIVVGKSHIPTTESPTMMPAWPA
ncbi:hypothetical protein NKJ06_13280 [Mesorhizobium sp. M0293]|uniref:hypothetical protein n=1 Tax=Mesorhizobium sp. M0293 TaxID=2956930 RepID=UPI003339F60F